MFSVAEVQAKVFNCHSANKSCLLQVVHTKAIAALTQFCDFLTFSPDKPKKDKKGPKCGQIKNKNRKIASKLR